MSFLDILDNLVMTGKLITKKDVPKLYAKALEYLNTIKLSRYKALYYGSLQIGPDMCQFDTFKEFRDKYYSVCHFVVGDNADRCRNNNQGLVESSLIMLYAMLSLYMTTFNIDFDCNELIEENDKYVTDEELKEEFKEVEV